MDIGKRSARRRGGGRRRPSLSEPPLVDTEAQRLAHVGSWSWDVSGDRVVWTEELYRIYGLGPDQFKGTYASFMAHVHPEDRAYTAEVVAKAVREGGSFGYDHRIVRPGGEVRMLATRGGAVRGEDGSVAGLRGCCMDVTEQWEVRRKLDESLALLRTLNNELEARVSDRTQELARKARELERSNSELEIFGAAISHDLNAPLRKISSFVSLLTPRAAGKLDETERSMLERIGKAAAGMSRLIADVLTLSRVSREALDSMPVDLNVVLAEVRSDFEAQLTETRGSIEAGPLPVVLGHRSLWRRLLQNIVSNGIKFRVAGRPPRIVIGAAPSPDGGVRLSFEDNGIGFDSKYAEQIFTPFHRLNPVSDYEGSGLGLSICERIVRRYGGTIRAKSEPGCGSLFVIELPPSVKPPL